MRTYDLTPLIRTSIGFDRMTRLMDAALKLEDNAKGYPPYNIAKKGEDEFRITLAVAGFGTPPAWNDPTEDTMPAPGPACDLADLLPNRPSGAWILGAGFDASVCLQGAGVAEQHLLVLREGPMLVVVPLTSSTTELNGHGLIGPAELRPGDRLRLGEEVLTWGG